MAACNAEGLCKSIRLEGVFGDIEQRMDLRGRAVNALLLSYITPTKAETTYRFGHIINGLRHFCHNRNKRIT
jgi:hypothetical protein